MAKMGRPKIEIDPTQFEKLCRIFCTLDDVAGWFNCSPDTIENWCRSHYGETFSDIYKKKSGHGRASLRRKQFQMALKGDRALLIWLGKQHLNQSEKLEQKAEVKDTTNAIDEDLLRQIIEAKECRERLPKLSSQ